MTSIPTVCLDHMSPEQRRAYVFADNRLSDESKFDREIVAAELEELLALDLGFEITDVGFDISAIDELINDLHAEPPEPACRAVGGVPSLARAGDLWALGKHRLLCGDTLDPLSYQVLMGGELARAAIVDPPFNCRVQGHVSGHGKVKHDEFAMASGEMTDAEFRAFLPPRSATWRRRADPARSTMSSRTGTSFSAC